MTKKKSIPNEAATLHQRAEEKTRADGAKTPERLSPEQTQQVLHELRVQLIELEEQNEELRQKQVEPEAGRVGNAPGKRENLLPLIYNTLSDIIFVLAVEPDDNFRFVSVNQSFLNVTGLSIDQVIGKRYQVVVPELAHALVLGNYKKAIQEKKTVHWEETYVYPAGKRYGEVSVTPAFDEGGKCSQLIGLVHDITGHKQVEEKLEEERILLQMLIDYLPDRVYVMDVQGRKIISNNADWQASGGKTMEDIIGKTDLDTYPPELGEDYWALDKTVIDSGISIINREEPGLDSLGNPVWVLSSKVPLRDGQGKVVGLVGIGRDITERKEAEKTLRALSTRQEAILDAIPDILMEVDNDKVYTWANPAGFEFFGEDVIGKKAAFYFEGDQDTYGRVKPLFNGDENVIYVESWQRCKDGKKRLLAWRCRVLKDSDGNVIGALSLAHDITESRQAEQQLAQYSEHLEEMVKERTHALSEAQEQLVRHERLAVLGQLAGGVGHELRNPLAVISNAVYYLKLVQPDADDKIKSYHDMIEHEVHTAEKIITDLLDFTRIKSVERELVAVSDLVRQTLERFPAPPPVEVVLELPADLPPVYADPRQMTQVLGNLTVNACQAMPTGGKLTLFAHRQEQMVAIAVKDSGVGIPPENLSKLFEPLFTTKLKGIGLGLAVSKKLAEANDGRIEVESEPGKGSTFSVYLPVYKE